MRQEKENLGRKRANKKKKREGKKKEENDRRKRKTHTRTHTHIHTHTHTYKRTLDVVEHDVKRVVAELRAVRQLAENVRELTHHGVAHLRDNGQVRDDDELAGALAVVAGAERGEVAVGISNE